MGIRLVSGRGFTKGDTEGAERVAIVNETLARRHWAGRDVVGAFLELGTRTRRRVRIVGVVADVRHFGPAEATHAEVYLPFAQAPSSVIGLAVRSRGSDAAVLADAVRHAVWDVDAEQPVSYLMTTREMARDVLAPSRVSAILVGLFALVALALAAVGTYGLLASMVNSRTREIGLRMALGADRRGMVALVLRDALTPVALGMAGGLLAALALTRLLQGLLYGVSAFDPLTFAAMSLAVLVAATVAAAVPARRAATVDPNVALRQE
jgi:putative ABC transport system permease protein